MTEKRGGSDVANATDTLAVEKDGEHELFGYKWFTSAIDSDISLALAWDVDQEGKSVPGTNGLSMYFIPIRQEGELNKIEVIRLKDKLGTR